VTDRNKHDMRAQNDMVAEHFRRSCETLSRAAEDPKLRAAIHAIADAITDAFRAGHKLLIAGNGGSAADAQHIAGEFLSRLNFDRNPLPAIALTTDTSVLTAIGTTMDLRTLSSGRCAASVSRVTFSSRFPRPADRRTCSRRSRWPATMA